MDFRRVIKPKMSRETCSGRVLFCDHRLCNAHVLYCIDWTGLAQPVETAPANRCSCEAVVEFGACSVLVQMYKRR